jgi:hypothetical protein
VIEDVPVLVRTYVAVEKPEFTVFDEAVCVL